MNSVIYSAHLADGISIEIQNLLANETILYRALGRGEYRSRVVLVMSSAIVCCVRLHDPSNTGCYIIWECQYIPRKSNQRKCHGKIMFQETCSMSDSMMSSRRCLNSDNLLKHFAIRNCLTSLRKNTLAVFEMLLDISLL